MICEMAKLESNFQAVGSQFPRDNVPINFWPMSQQQQQQQQHSETNDRLESEDDCQQNLLSPKRTLDNRCYNFNQQTTHQRSAERFGIRGPSGSVRGFRDFVRQSAANLHELNDLSVNDELIYVDSDSLLARKILEQEEDGNEEEFLEEEEESRGVIQRRRARLLRNTHRKQQQLKEINEEVENEDKDEEESAKSSSCCRQPRQTNDRIAQRKRQALRRLYLEKLALSEQNRCVLYTTSLSVIRRTFDDSKLMRNILTLNLIGFEERDVYLNREYRIQLKLRVTMSSDAGNQPNSSQCNNHRQPTMANDDNLSPRTNFTTPITSHFLPCLFVDGRLFCRLKDLELLNETARISEVLGRFKLSSFASSICKCCGNARFIACQKCNGSRRSMVHHFRHSSVALSCIRCDKNDGLVACPRCNDISSETFS